MISPMQRPLPDNKQHTKETDILVLGGFKPTVSAIKQSQTHALDRAATGICLVSDY
jgi:hypothetical protein